MKFSITREELVDMINSAPRPALKDILTNHLHVMDGQNTECGPCKLFDEVESEPITFEGPEEDSEDEYPDEPVDEEE